MRNGRPPRRTSIAPAPTNSRRVTVGLVSTMRQPSTAKLLLGAELTKRAEPVLHVIRLGDLPILDGLDVDGHHAEALAGVGYAEQLTSWRSSDLAPDDHAVTSHEHFLDVE